MSKAGGKLDELSGSSVNGTERFFTIERTIQENSSIHL